MLRQSILVAGFLAMLGTTLQAGAQAPTAKPAPPDAEELLRQANDLWHLKKDYNGALAAFNQALEAAPNDGDVRLQRAIFFELISGIVTKDKTEQFKELARQDYRKVAGDAPDSTRAGVARDSLTRMAGKTLLAPPEVTCPQEATDAHELGESLYGASRLPEAVSQYEKAVAGCPGAAYYWVDYADAYYRMEQYEKAKELFKKAIEVDPWSRTGHRFLADTEWHLKDGEASIRQAALAVVSDPIYEAAWGSLRNYANATGRAWKRVFGVKTEVTAKDSQKGTGKDVTITVPTTKPAKPDPEGTAWMAYGLFKAGALSGSVTEHDAAGKPVEKKIDPNTLTALDTERLAVRGALDVMGEVAASTSDRPGPFWSMMMRADKAGFLDEAIFLHMLDESLAKEYPAYREKNAAKLVEYLETVIVPKN